MTGFGKRADRVHSFGKVLFANVFNNATSFIVTVHAARSFGPAVFGQFGLALAIMLFASTLLDFGLNISLVRNYNSTESLKERADLAASVIKTKLGVVIAVALLAYPVSLPLLRIFPVLKGNTHLLAVGLVSAALLSLWTSIRGLEQARREFSSFARYNYLYAVMRSLCYGGVFLLHANSPIAVLLSLYTVPLLLLLSYTLLREYSVWWPLYAGIDGQSAALRKALAYGRWICGSMILYSLFMRLPQFELARHSSARMLGLFGAAVSFLAAFSLINDAISSIILPEVASLGSPGARNLFRQALIKHLPKLAALLVLALAGCVLAQLFLLGKAYHDSVPVFAVLGVATIVSLCFSINNNLVHAYGRPELWLYMNLGRLSVLGVVLNALHKPGAMSVAIAYGTISVGGDLWLFVYLRRYSRLDRAFVQHLEKGVHPSNAGEVTVTHEKRILPRECEL